MMSEEKKERLRRKRQCNAVREEYLRELRRLTTVEEPEGRLLSFDETRRFQEHIQPYARAFDASFELPFDDRTARQTIAQRLTSAPVDGPFFLFTGYSNRCSPMRLADLDEFCWAFDFNDEHAGIVSITALSPYENVLFDFFEDAGTRWLEVEIFGEHWGPMGKHLAAWFAS